MTSADHDASVGRYEAKTSRLRSVWANPLLWTLQGWLAMFYVAAGYAKLTEPRELLIALLSWPTYAPPVLVTVVGWAELLLAVLLLSPLLSWRFGRPAMFGSALAITVSAAVMALIHGASLQPGHVVTNLILMALGIGVIVGRQAHPPPAVRPDAALPR
ncbi:hypothetical protein BZG35_16370 [Brevundimonas sp. LM2]|uniref:DoxX family protein n=1 Tax=Brevundimonas sp. LM2 TaxID=1938605 RepID=UPI000983DEF7|nr:DoxX family protein [Brevundimonas sp. LM2]AQR63057.1 hypothetical protein BZG35_16370 [Brevundimonas sp. LM2]